MGTNKQRHDSEAIIRKLRQADVLLAQGKAVQEICRELGVSDATYYKWRRAYGGMAVEQARRLKDLERENSRLKQAVADLTLDKVILKEAARGNY
jgi:transposase-like protein